MKYIFMGFIKVYKKIISPLFPPCCKYHPTCSSYALEALKKTRFYQGRLACGVENTPLQSLEQRGNRLRAG